MLFVIFLTSSLAKLSVRIIVFLVIHANYTNFSHAVQANSHSCLAAVMGGGGAVRLIEQTG